MRTLNRLLAGLWLSLPYLATAQQNTEIPSVCNDSAGIVALLDCLHNQQEILRQVLEYKQLITQITELNQNLNEPPQVSNEMLDDDSKSGLDRVNWFDQNLEVYAIVGAQNALTAYARLDGREYRLQAGDSIRLALVTNVHSRGIHLQVSGHEISIGISGLSAAVQKRIVAP